MQLSKGQFTAEDEKAALALITNNCIIPGVFDVSDIVEVVGTDESTPLLTAVMHSNFNVVKVLVENGAECTKTNSSGADSILWAHWINNPRIKALFADKGVPHQEKLEKLKQLKSKSIQDSMVLTLAMKPKKLVNLGSESGIAFRMDTFVKLVNSDQYYENFKNMIEQNKNQSTFDLLKQQGLELDEFTSES